MSPFPSFRFCLTQIQAREINKPGLCLKDPPKAPEPDQPIQNTPADQESDKFE